MPMREGMERGGMTLGPLVSHMISLPFRKRLLQAGLLKNAHCIGCSCTMKRAPAFHAAFHFAMQFDAFTDENLASPMSSFTWSPKRNVTISPCQGIGIHPMPREEMTSKCFASSSMPVWASCLNL
eukprot:1981499-Amphidinium_carterae.1